MYGFEILALAVPSVGVAAICQACERAWPVLAGAGPADVDAHEVPPGRLAAPAVGVVLVLDHCTEAERGLLCVAGSLHVDTTDASGR